MLLDLNDPQKMGLLSLGLRLMSTPGKFGAALGQSGLGALGDMRAIQSQNDQGKDREMRRGIMEQQQVMQQLQLQQAIQAQKDRQAQMEAQRMAEQQKRGFLGSLDTSAGVGQPFDPARALAAGLSPQEIQMLKPKDPEPVDYNKMVVPGPDGMPMLNPLWVQGRKATQQPAAVVNVGTGQKDRDWGTPPKDHVWARDASGEVMTERDPKTGAFRPIAAPIGGSDQAAVQSSSIATMTDTLNTLDKAIKHPGRTTATGISGIADPRNAIPGTDAMNFKILADQIGGKAFLQAFESLKGGGQITEVEGRKATDAIARLNRAQSDEEYLQALQDFRDVVGAAYKRATGKDYKPAGPTLNPSIGAVPGVPRFLGFEGQ